MISGDMRPIRLSGRESDTLLFIGRREAWLKPHFHYRFNDYLHFKRRKWRSLRNLNRERERNRYVRGLRRKVLGRAEE